MTALYTLHEVCRLWGHTKAKVRKDFFTFGVRAVGHRADNPQGYKREHLYCVQDFAEVISYWEWERLYAWVDACWSRFAKDPCGACPRCRHHYSVAKAALYCERNRWPLMDYRRTFKRFLQALQAHGSIAACWRQEGSAFLTQNGKLVEGRSLLLIYLLDRHLLELSCDELIDLLPQRMERPITCVPGAIDGQKNTPILCAASKRQSMRPRPNGNPRGSGHPHSVEIWVTRSG